jgi:hypothetical protein
MDSWKSARFRTARDPAAGVERAGNSLAWLLNRRRAMLALFLVAFALAVASCRKPITVALDTPFRLEVGRAARVAKSDLDLYFRRVQSDSRCPANVTCITAGEAIVVLEGRILEGPVEPFEVGLPGGAVQQDSIPKRAYDGYRIQLLKLDPYPTAGGPVDTTAYVGTFRVEKR